MDRSVGNFRVEGGLCREWWLGCLGLIAGSRLGGGGGEWMLGDWV